MLLYLKDLNVCSDKAEFSFLQKKTAFWCSFKRVPNWMFLWGGLVRLSMLLTSALTKCLLSLLSWEMLSSTTVTISAVGILRGASNVSLVHIWKSIKKRFSFAKKENSALSEHTCLTNHRIGWDKSKTITTNRRYHQRLCLEAWHINFAHAPLNRDDGGLLPGAY